MFDYKNRITQFRKKIASQKLDAFITSFSPHLCYLTGYSGSNGLAIITKEKTFFLTDGRYTEQIKTEVVADKTFIEKKNLIAKAAKEKILQSSKIVGFEKNHISYSIYLELPKTLPKIHWKPTEDIVENIASLKDEKELALISKAVSITDKVFSKIITLIKEGISELDISAEISYLHKKYGAEGDSFEPIVASGIRSSFPHGRASSKKIAKGEFITLDFGCVYNGYCSDMTRTIVLGKPSAEMKKIYSIVLDAQKKSIEKLRSGMKAKKIDSIARNYITSKGYGKYFNHSLGHGLGMQVHEAPKISSQSSDTLHAGNIITIEPGIYLPNKFGVRIEDNIVVKDNEYENLTKSPKELIVI